MTPGNVRKSSSAAALAAAAGDPEHVRGFKLVLLVGALLVAQILDGMDMNALAFVGTAVSKDLGLTRSMFGASVGAAFLGTAVGAVLFGAVADRFGRRRTLLMVVTLIGCGSLLTSQVTSAAELTAVRFLTGTALGGLVPISSAILISWVAPSARTTAITIVVGGSAGGTILAGVVSSLAVPTFGWRSMFVIGGIAPLAIIPLLLAIVPADRKPDAETKNVISGREFQDESPRASLFREGAWRLTLCAWLGMFFSAIPLFVAVGWLPSLIENAGASRAQAAFAASLFAVGGAIGGVVAGNLTDRFGLKVIFLMAASGAVATATLGSAIGTPFAGPIAGGAGFFVIGLLTLMTAVVGQLYPDTIRGLGVGASLAMMRIGAALAPWGAGRLLDLGASNILLFLLCGASALASGLAFTIAARSRRVYPT